MVKDFYNTEGIIVDDGRSLNCYKVGHHGVIRIEKDGAIYTVVFNDETEYFFNVADIVSEMVLRI